MLLMWETPLHGNDGGESSVEDFTLEGQPTLALTGQLQLLSSTPQWDLSLRPTTPNVFYEGKSLLYYSGCA